MGFFVAILATLAGLSSTSVWLASGALPEQCNFDARTGADTLTIPINKDTVAWGYSYKYRAPVAYVQSGEIFNIETASHHAGDFYEGMIKGDPGMESIYNWTSTAVNTPSRGAHGVSDGVHILTGNVYICGAEVGDTVEVRVLDMKPRLNPLTGLAYASNGQAYWGWHYRTGFVGSKPRDSAIIYRIFTDKDGYAIYAAPEFSFVFKDKEGNSLVETPCFPLNGSLPGLLSGKTFEWSNPNSTFSGYHVPCVNGTMKWGGYWVTGAIIKHPIGTEDYSIKGAWRVPAMPHIGYVGISSDWDGPVNSIFPMRTGGNLDHKRLGKGSKLFLNVEVEGALLSAGDAHAMQGTGEYDGTGLESNWNVKMQVIVHKKAKVEGTLYGDLPTPLLENNNEWCFHGFNFNDYLHDERLMPDPQAVVGGKGIDTLYQLMNNTAVVARDGLMKMGFNEDSANSILTAGCDWEMTQVVDGNLGQNICCYKYLLQKNTTATTYIPKTFPGTSRPWKIKTSQSAYL